MADQLNQGKILSIRSSVVDVQFSVAPQIRNVLTAGEKGEYIIEVFTQLDSNTIRGVALTPTQGLTRGATVTDTGKPFEVPVGPALMGRVFNVFGNTIDKKGNVEGCEVRSIHREPIPLRPKTHRGWRGAVQAAPLVHAGGAMPPAAESEAIMRPAGGFDVPADAARPPGSSPMGIAGG